ncbi:AMP-binding protein, partial [Oryctes borbonicus]
VTAIQPKLILFSSCAKRFNSRWRKCSNLSYIHKIGSEPLRYMSIGELLERAAIKYRDRPSLISRGQNVSITFGDLLEKADRLAAGFRALGLQKGDRVGLCLPNQYEWNVVLFACLRADLMLVALNPAYQAREIEYCINKVGISTMIFGDKFRKQNYYELLGKVCPNITRCEPGKIKSTNVPSLKTAIFISDDSFKGTYGYNEIINLGSENFIKSIKRNQHLIKADSACILQFTSGTTGEAKATMASHFNVVNNSYSIAKRVELNTKHHTICLSNPLFHAFGIVVNTVGSLHFGTTSVLPGIAYNPNETLDAIKEERCTVIYGTPTMHVDLVDVQTKRKEDINPEIALTGGALCSAHLFKSMLEVLKVKKVKSIFGQTEATGVVFHSMPDDDLYLSTATIGYIGDHIEAKVIDSEGHLVPFGQPGELCVRGYVSMLGYWEDEEKTRETISKDGWLRTGDLFILEKNGYGKIIGRLKEMIIRGGENIYPKEIEDFLNTHPNILEAHVIGVPHERLGEEVCVFVRLKEGKTLTYEQMVEFCKGEISYFKIPAHLRVLNDLPKTASGKVQKFKLKELF